MSVAEILAQFEGQDLIPLPDLGKSIGLDRGRQTYAIEKGLIKPSEKRGANGRYLVDRDQAAIIVIAAALAAAAGLALVTMLRSLLGIGAEVGPAGITIPLGAC
jgi:hypothetical protein